MSLLRPWALTLTAIMCVLLGVAFALGDVPYSGGFPMPHRFGYYLLAASFAAGLVFGKRGCALPVVGIAAFGVTRLLQATVHPTGDDERKAIFLFFVVGVPLFFAAIAAIGAELRNAFRGRSPNRSS